MKKFCLFMIGLIVCFSSFGYGMSSGYHGQAAEAVHKVHDVLIANNICQVTEVSPQGYKYNNCTKKELVFGTPGYDGFYISTNGVTNKKVLSQIVSVLKSEYIRYDGKVSVGFKAFSSTYTERKQQGFIGYLRQIIFREDVILDIEFKRKRI